jgi:hypothetical protein
MTKGWTDMTHHVVATTRSRWLPIVTVLSFLAALLPMTALTVVTSASPAAAVPNDLTISLVNARSINDLVEGHAIDSAKAYTWLITSDDTGDPTVSAQSIAACVPSLTNPDPLHDSGNGQSACQWPSIRTTPGNVPVIASGTQDDLSKTKALTNLPDGKFLVSVLADGYALGGAHFTVPLDGTVTVPLQPYPLPLGTMKIEAFHDYAPVDATFEVDGESVPPNSTWNMAGYEAHLTDVMGEVTTDWFGNPLCTNYVHTGGKVAFDSSDSPIIDPTNPGGRCVSNANGIITIPNLGSNRYGVTLSKPANKQDWIQTTTLEGTHDHDVWVMPGDTGLDSELVVGGEAVPWVQFGYVEPRNLPAGPAAHVTGQVLAGLTYVGGNGGITIPGGTGTAGGKEGPPIDRPWIALSDLGNGDQMVYMGRGNKDGTFDIANVPNGSYQLTAWDDVQDYILFSSNVTVSNNTTVDTGKTYLSGWMGRIYGTVFIDTNANGKRDPGEQGVPRTAVTLRERDNSLMDQMQNTVTTNSKGEYSISEGYPLTRWVVLEHFNTRYEGTGITFQGENDPQETTLLGAAVDVNTLPIIGLGGRVDWGVRPYAPDTNGGIVGTITYDTTRNELDPAYAVTEPYQPGIPGIKVHLYPVLKDPTTGEPILPNGDPIPPGGHPVADKAHELTAPYVSETWTAPKGCTPRQWDGTPLILQALPTDRAATCIEAPSDGAITMPADNNPDAFAQTVNGNYGFATSDLNLYSPVDTVNNPQGLALYAPLAEPQPLIPDDYVVTVDMPKDLKGKPIYQVTREQDVNVFDGDAYVPQENLVNYNGPTAQGSGPGVPVTTGPGAPEAPPSQGGGLGVSPCVGADQTVQVLNNAFNDGGGSPYEGQIRPLCDEKLVTVRGQQATAPNFNLFTQTPLPTHFWGLTINDLGLSWDKSSIQYGEAQGIPHVPMGIYDFSGHLIDTTTTDYNGFYEAIEPSTSSYNCPLPAGPCPGMYRFVGNDPGQPGQRNANYNPRFRTISANFQAWPGLFTVTDTAPTQSAAVIITPGTTSPQPVVCDVSSATPEVFAVNTPWVSSTGSRTITVTGKGFGASAVPQNAAGTTGSRVELVPEVGNNPAAINVTTTSWSDSSITFNVPTGGPFADGGPFQLRIRNGTSQIWSSSAITINVQGTDYSPSVKEVPSASYATIQAAISSVPQNSNANVLILIHPGNATRFNPEGAYLENLVVNRKVKLQGYGPGGVYPNGTSVAGSVVDGQAFNADGDSGTAWFALAGLPHAGPVGVPDGATISVTPRTTGQFPTAVNNRAFASIDGLKITGGFQQDVAGNLNAITGANVTGFGAPGAAVTQGGGIYVHAFAHNLRITNNLIIGNSGSYGGGVRVGTPYLANNNNDHVRISYNRVRDNGGTNLAGGIGLFRGSDSYTVDHNDICGNFSAEYGGGVSHFGLSPNGVVDHNRIWLNETYDEGAGVMVAGELPADANNISTGSGPVTITANEIVVNNANDDGGGLRLLQTNDALMMVNNNIIADNLSTHEGGGVALDDATNVQFLNNTVARNITTATAVTSDGSPAPAGLSTGLNSVQLQNVIGSSRSVFSNPVMRNNVFWENKAGTWDGTKVKGIGTVGSGDENIWDMGAGDGSGVLSPTYGVLTKPRSDAGQVTTSGSSIAGTNVPLTSTATTAPYFDVVTDDPAAVSFVNPYSISVDVSTLRTFPGFRQAVIVARNVAPDQQGNYHLKLGVASVEVNLGVGRVAVGAPQLPATTNVDAPRTDIDGNTRYGGQPTSTTRLDAGADELP